MITIGCHVLNILAMLIMLTLIFSGFYLGKKKVYTDWVRSKYLSAQVVIGVIGLVYMVQGGYFDWLVGCQDIVHRFPELFTQFRHIFLF